MKALLNVCVHSVRLSASLILPLSGALCGLIIKISFPSRLLIKNRLPVGSSAAEVNYYVVRYILAHAMPGQEVFRA